MIWRGKDNQECMHEIGNGIPFWGTPARTGNTLTTTTEEAMDTYQGTHRGIEATPFLWRGGARADAEPLQKMEWQKYEDHDLSEETSILQEGLIPCAVDGKC